MHRLRFLDSLRGLAALYVVIFHTAFVPSMMPTLPAAIKPIVEFGGSGVMLFFVISGFSLCLTMPYNAQRESPTVSFYIKRFFRIAPLFYMLLLATLLRDLHIFNTSHPIREIILDITFLFNFIPGYQTSIVWAGWTIGVEMPFYVIFPIIYYSCTSIIARMALVILTVIMGIIFFVYAIPTMPHLIQQGIGLYASSLYVPIFVMGMAGFSIYDYLRLRHPAKFVGIAFIFVGIFGLSYCLPGRIDTIRPVIVYLEAVFYMILTVGLAIAPLLVFVNCVTTFLGKISYSVYLSHPVVITLMSPVYRYIIERLSGHPILSFLGCAMATVAVVIPISLLSYRYVELPGISAGKRLLEFFEERRYAQISLTK